MVPGLFSLRVALMSYVGMAGGGRDLASGVRRVCVVVTGGVPLSKGLRGVVGVPGRERVLILLFALWAVSYPPLVLEQRSYNK